MTVVVNPSVPVGVIHEYAGLTAPSGYLLCDGSSVSRTTYASLFATLTTARGNPTVTIASPGVFTLASHGLSIGEIVYLTTTGTLPTGLSANTQYFVAATSFATNTFTLTASYGGSAINTAAVQSGTHTLTSCPYGFASSTNFYVPDMRGRVPMGAGTGAQNGGSGSGAISGGTSLTARVRGVFGGDERLQTHTHVQNAHTHTQNAHGHNLGDGQSFGMSFGGNGGAGATFAVAVADINCGTYQGSYYATANTATNQSTTATNQNAGSGSSENMPPFVVINYIIKT